MDKEFRFIAETIRWVFISLLIGGYILDKEHRSEILPAVLFGIIFTNLLVWILYHSSTLIKIYIRHKTIVDTVGQYFMTLFGWVVVFYVMLLTYVLAPYGPFAPYGSMPIKECYERCLIIAGGGFFCTILVPYIDLLGTRLFRLADRKVSKFIDVMSQYNIEIRKK